MPPPTDLRTQIAAALAQFAHGDLRANTLALFAALGYKSDKQLRLSEPTPDSFRNTFRSERFNPANALVPEWRYVDLSLQLTEAELHQSAQRTLFDARAVDLDNYHSYLVFCLELDGRTYSRTELAKITREINIPFQMPALVLFKHGSTLTLSVIDRRLHKRDETKDVLEKVTFIKDIRIPNPLVGTNAHRAHIEILYDLSLPKLTQDHPFTNFTTFHEAWRAVLDTSELNKRFFRELANWFYWAKKHVTFPNGAGKDVDERNARALIRLLTRLIFVWFIKEKEWVPDSFFAEAGIKQILKDNAADNSSSYYQAVLQNLFFATLNTPMNRDEPDSREFRSEKHRGVNKDYLVPNKYRYAALLRDPEAFLTHCADIPFLNGGLFQSLDRELEHEELDNKELVALATNEGKQLVLRVDGFSERDDNPLRVPNYLFFAEANPKSFSPKDNAYLNETFGTKTKDYGKDVRGVIRLLDRYKFTVDENTPIEQEIALDPELLGKVFENLLAAYNPETGVTARKQTGSFYTPREIVNYMVDESLIAYLETRLAPLPVPPLPEGEGQGVRERLRHLLSYTTDEPQFNDAEKRALVNAIDDLKILDPACGSGAFPMGVLHKLVHILGKLDPKNQLWKEKQVATASTLELADLRENTLRQIEERFAREQDTNYARKLYLIQNCIFGVDIQPIAVQIAKLRCFISLIVDERIREHESNRGVLALPNLETKFVAANSLIGIAKQKTLRYLSIEQKEEELAGVRRNHFNAKTHKDRGKYRKRDKELRNEITSLLEQSGLSGKEALLLARWNPYDQNAAASFYDSEWMFNVKNGFDIIIGNPPYIKEYTYREAFDGVRDSPYYQGKMDIWYLFACKALDELRRDTGVLTFIATNNWNTAAGASALRTKILNDATMLYFLDFGSYKIFESADIQTMILMARRNPAEPSYSFDLRKLTAPDATFAYVLDLLNKKPNAYAVYLQAEFDRVALRNKLFTFAEDTNDHILTKLAKRANIIFGEKEVAVGIDVHQDAVNKASQRILGTRFKVGDGIFILSREEKNEIPFTDTELKLIRPYYTTNELDKYYGQRRNQSWVIYTDSSFKDPRNIRGYPNIKRHLDKFCDVITSDNWPYGLHRARDERFFKGEKIISLRKATEPTFTYTDFDCYVSQTFNVIKTNRVDLKYLTGLLNSKLVKFWLLHKGKMQGHHFQVDKEPLLTIPLYLPKYSEHEPIIKLVDRILAAKRADPSADTTALEREIDQLIYQLYGLTGDEIAIVEGKKSA